MTATKTKLVELSTFQCILDALENIISIAEDDVVSKTTLLDDYCTLNGGLIHDVQWYESVCNQLEEDKLRLAVYRYIYSAVDCLVEDY